MTKEFLGIRQNVYEKQWDEWDHKGLEAGEEVVHERVTDQPKAKQLLTDQFFLLPSFLFSPPYRNSSPKAHIHTSKEFLIQKQILTRNKNEF